MLQILWFECGFDLKKAELILDANNSAGKGSHFPRS